MASTASPYGFKPVNEVGGLPYAGSTRSFVLNPAGYGTNIFNGSLVYVATTGYLQLVTADGSDGTTNAFPAGTTLTGAVGVFVGCSYVNAQGQTVQAQYYPTGVTNAIAYVVLDPQAAYKVAVTNNGTTGTVTYVTRSVVGKNAVVAQGSGSTTSGDSGESVEANTTASNAEFAVRIIDVVPETAINATAFREVIVKLNQPQFQVTTGL